MEHFFGWRLHVDRHVARLIKERQYNDWLRPTQRDIFDLRRRTSAFCSPSSSSSTKREFHRQNVSPDDDRPLRFLLSDFVIRSATVPGGDGGGVSVGAADLRGRQAPCFSTRPAPVRAPGPEGRRGGRELPAGMEEHSPL